MAGFQKTLAWFFLGLVIAGCQKAAPPPKPNIILIVVDDLGWRDLGFMGSSFYETPHIDALAASGIHFTEAYAAAAVCSPTRASILTGRYPARIGITDWIRGRYSGVKVPADSINPYGYDTIPGNALLTPKVPIWMEHSEVTLAEVLQDAGYVTAHIGKWHLGPEGWHPEQQGFDFNFGGADYGQPPSYFDPYEEGGFRIESLPGQRAGEYLTDREADEAVQFIRQQADSPFFLNLWHYAVHTPLQAPDSITAKYLAKQASRPDLPPFREEDRTEARFASKTPLEGQRNPIYAAMIERVDAAVGRIIRTLDALDQRRNTIIVFFSDNGGHIVSTDNAPLRMGKGFPYEGGIREPLIVSWPGKIDAGIHSNVPVSSIDLFPTLLQLAEIPIPDTLQLDGLDISPALHQSGTIARPALFWHFPHYWWGDTVKPFSIVRAGEWKLIRHYEDDRYELFNLAQDASETHDLSLEMPEKVAELRSMLDSWLVETKAVLPIPQGEPKN